MRLVPVLALALGLTAGQAINAGPAAAVCDERPEVCEGGREVGREVGDVDDTIERVVREGRDRTPPIISRCDGDRHASGLTYSDALGGSGRRVTPLYVGFTLVANGACPGADQTICSVTGLGTSSGHTESTDAGSYCLAITSTLPPYSPNIGAIDVHALITGVAAEAFLVPSKRYVVVCLYENACEPWV